MTERTGFDKITACVFMIGAICGLYFQFAYHKFLNNDTLAYINLAERYAAGDFQHAINGYWSPLYSWLLSVCKMADLPLLQSCYVINFIAAALCLYVVCSLARRYLIHPVFYFAFSLYALLMVLFYAMSTLTPDLLATSFCLWFLLLATSNRFTSNKQMPLLAGIAAACAYYTKLYNFIPMHLFLASWLLSAFINKKTVKLKPLVPVIKTYGIFILLSSLWIVILSVHEGKLVFTTAGRFNHNIVSPYYGKSFPTNTNLFAPPFEKAYSVHTDPSHLLNDYDWSPFRDTQSFLHQVTLLKDSLLTFIKTLDSTGAKWLVLIGALCILFINRKKIKNDHDRGIYKIAWFFTCYPLLYFPLFILDRYIVLCIVLFHLLLAFLVQQAYAFINKKIFLPVMAILLIVSIIPFGMIGQRKLTASSGEYRYYKSFYQHLPQLTFLQNQPIASDTHSMVEATQLCYYFNCRHYCTWTDEKYQSLKQYNIRYLISKKEFASLPFLHVKQEIVVGKNTIYIYEIQ
jgi:hypothetical protein